MKVIFCLAAAFAAQLTSAVTLEATAHFIDDNTCWHYFEKGPKDKGKKVIERINEQIASKKSEQWEDFREELKGFNSKLAEILEDVDAEYIHIGEEGYCASADCCWHMKEEFESKIKKVAYDAKDYIDKEKAKHR